MTWYPPFAVCEMCERGEMDRALIAVGEPCICVVHAKWRGQLHRDQKRLCRFSKQLEHHISVARQQVKQAGLSLPRSASSLLKMEAPNVRAGQLTKRCDFQHFSSRAKPASLAGQALH